MRDIPNLITLLRIAIVPSVCVAILQQSYGLALLLFGLAGISDALDGYIAKRFDLITRLGSILDPLADKLLLVSTFVTLAWMALLPTWLVAVVVGRDVLIVCGALAYHTLIARYEMEPTLVSKANTLFQIVLGLAVVVDAWRYPLPDDLLHGLTYMVFAVTLLSGADYVYSWGTRAVAERERRRRQRRGQD
ncbi:MAG: CDP-alcohol phosphatidyltransferase family protein [Gammaproteobacteria bacterium]|nr:CDP-alcohol phosphatidyltransferase family protein [Gammaproteobacteria bacterium]